MKETLVKNQILVLSVVMCKSQLRFLQCSFQWLLSRGVHRGGCLSLEKPCTHVLHPTILQISPSTRADPKTSFKIPYPQHMNILGVID